MLNFEGEKVGIFGLAEVLRPPPQVTNPQSATFDEGSKILIIVKIKGSRFLLVH
jgi:hypothetical protein